MGTRRGARRTWLAAAVAAAVALPVVGLAAPPSGATSGFTLTRLAGADRYATAATVATTTFTSATTAIIATGANFPDALSASFLAGNVAGGAPILLTTTNDPVPSPTMSALSSLKVKNVVIVGGGNAVGSDVENTLSNTPSTNAAGGNLSVTRIAGDTRYDTMQKIDTAPGSSVGSFNGKKTAFVATGQDFPDALGAGPVAYAQKFPIVLTDPAGLSPQAGSTLTGLGIQQVMILGGTAAVGAAVESSINGMGITTLQRFAGADRSDTSKLLADYSITNFAFKNTKVDVASGDESFGGADALAAGPLGGTTAVPTVVTNTATDPGKDVAFASEHASTLASGFALGGANPLAESAVQQIETAGGSTQFTGNITLASTTVVQGGTLNGTISEPGTISSITADGCGLTNQTVTFSASTGAFTVTIPASQPVGNCTLTFTVKFNNTNPTRTEPFTITVTSATAALAAPSLVGVTVTPATGPGTFDSAAFTFNQPLATALPSPSNFRIYRASGAFSVGTGAPVLSGDTWTVSFPPGAADNAALGAVRAGTVTNPSNDPNFASSVAVNNGPKSTLVTNEPDLTSVGQPAQDSPPAGSPPTFTVTYAFDKPVQTTGVIATPPGGTPTTYCTPVPSPGHGTPAFEVMQSNGTTMTEPAPAAGFLPPYTTTIDPTLQSCTPGSDVIVTYPGTVTALNLVAGAVTQGRVEGFTGDTIGNPLESGLIASPPTNPIYPLLQKAVENYNGSTGTTDVILFFNGAPPGPTDPTKFDLIEGTGTEVQAGPTSVVPTPGNSSALTATFPSSAVATGVGVAVSKGGLGGGFPDSSIALSPSGTPSGQVVMPQLTAVSITPATLGSPTVTFTFDKNLTPTGTGTEPGNDFVLYTTAGVASFGTGTGTVNNNVVTFSGSILGGGGFTSAQTTGAVAGGVQDATSNNPPLFPEATVHTS